MTEHKQWILKTSHLSWLITLNNLYNDLGVIVVLKTNQYSKTNAPEQFLNLTKAFIKRDKHLKRWCPKWAGKGKGYCSGRLHTSTYIGGCLFNQGGLTLGASRLAPDSESMLGREGGPGSSPNISTLNEKQTLVNVFLSTQNNVS